MSDFFEPATLIHNGYWYTFHYCPTTHIGFDEYPLVYCVEPSTNAMNNFCALNIHLLPLSDRIKFILLFEKTTKFLSSDRRCFLFKDDLIDLFKSSASAIRYYNRKNIRDVYRIKNQYVPHYIEYDGKIIMKDPGTVMNKYLINLGYLNSNEALKKNKE